MFLMSRQIVISYSQSGPACNTFSTRFRVHNLLKNNFIYVFLISTCHPDMLHEKGQNIICLMFAVISLYL
ncbi:hypothetical protein HMPREF9688_00525 [Klebsiella oxytoca 10-5244]|nr:hypothetical protein HMPREF9688_00525 [Klebsiella oxytoca 10-5244]MBZ7194963.1 hypothetical protein [Klebsiella oxytoca]TXU71239.1 hypothetical protein D4N05_20715 [Klebsiella oxytoca]CAA0340468.1 Uncharacterised protein [Klebsiella oxytoca]